MHLIEPLEARIAPATLNIAPPTAFNEGNTGTTNAVFTVTLSEPAPASGVTVSFATGDGSATVADSDYVARSGAVSFAQGEVSKTIDVSVNGDLFFETAETFTVTLSNPNGADIGTGTATATIANDDTRPTMSIANATIGEGGAARFNVSLSVRSSETITVNYATGDGTATVAASDYTATSGTLVFAPGETTKSIDVATTDDAIDEPDETFLVTLSGLTNATFADNQATGTILDNEPTPTLSIADVLIMEGNAGTTNAIFTVSLSVASSQTVRVHYATANGTATAGSDYTAVPDTELVFTPGQTMRTFNVSIIGDTVGELDETFEVNLTAPQNAVIGDGQAIGTIDNDEGPLLQIDDVTDSESAGQLTFTVRLIDGTSSPVTVNFATRDGTAKDGVGEAAADYLATSGTLTLSSEEPTKQITVTLTSDGLAELSENFFVDLSNPGGAIIIDGTGEGTITDDDAILSINDVTVTEGTNSPGTTNGTRAALFTVTLASASVFPVTVQFTTQDGTATSANGDYVARSGTLTFNSGETSKVIGIQVLGDTVFEPTAETFSVMLSSPTNANIGDGTGVATIQDDEPTAVIGDATIIEGDSGTRDMVFTVTLSAATTVPVAYNFTTQEGTAKAGTDYATTTGTLTFAPGETSKTISVPIVGDAVHEPTETFTVKLTGAPTTDDTATGTITDNDPAPVLTIGNATVTEGNSGTRTATFTVTLTGAASEVVTVRVSTQDGTASTADNDYSTLTQTLTFQPGETTKTFNVTVIGDTRGEATETFFANLSQPTNATIGAAQGIGTITNDDAALTIEDVKIVEGDSGTQQAIFTVRLENPPASTVTVNFATSNNLAIAGDDGDYEAKSGTLTFTPGGPTTQQIAVNVRGDTDEEIDETFFVTLSNAQNAGIARAQALGTIQNDETQIAINDISVAEGTGGNTIFIFTLTRSGGTANQAQVDFATANGSALAGTDYIAKTGSATFEAGSETATVEVFVTGDFEKEAAENFFLNLTGARNAILSDLQGEATIQDDDSPGISISDVTIEEGPSGTKDAVFTVTLAAASNENVMVNFATADGTATAGSDYTTRTGTLTFMPGGALTQTISVPILGDATDEADETFVVNLSGAVGGTITDNQGSGKILNDDLTLSVGDVTIVEGDTGTTNAVFRVRLSASPIGHPVTVRFAVQPGTATVADGDYVLPNETGTGTVTFVAGETDLETEVEIPIAGDLRDEGDETFSFILSEPTNAIIADGTAIGTITNDDAASITIDNLTIAEGDDGSSIANFIVKLSKPSTKTITVDFATADGTAIDGVGEAGSADYIAAVGTVTFAPGETQKTIAITISGDTAAEPDETFTVNLSNASNAPIADAQAIGTIRDARTLTIGDVTLTEGAGGSTKSFVFTVSLNGPAEQPISVNFATEDGTATAASDDYESANGTLNFAVGEQTKTITVTVNGDNVSEIDETFRVKLSGATNATLADDEATGRILNDESLFRIRDQNDTASVVTVEEGTGGTAQTNLLFKIIRSDATQAGSVQVRTIDGTAVSTGARPDFTPLALTTITFAAGETEKLVTIPVTRDAAKENQESFTVVLSNPTSGQIAPGQGTATGQITDDDTGPITINLSQPAAITEGNSGQKDLTFTVTLSGVDETGNVTVNFATADGTAVSTGTNPDYVANSGTLTFAPGETSKIIVVKVNGDTVDEADEQKFTLSLSGEQRGTIGTGSAEGKINDDDATPTLSFFSSANGDITVTEGNTGTSDAFFTLRLGTASESTVTVNFSTEDGSAVDGVGDGTAVADYVAKNEVITFMPGETQKIITVRVNGDTIRENNETFVARLSGATNATISDATATATISNDDANPALTINSVQVVEGATGTTDAVFTVTLANAAQDPVTVEFITVDGTAKDGVGDGLVVPDYVSTTGTLTFAGGETSKEIRVRVNGDPWRESDETFSVQLRNPSSNATIAAGQGTGTILAGDDTKIGVLIGNATVVEGDLNAQNQPVKTTVNIPVALTGPADAAVTFTARTSDASTALKAVDFDVLAPTTFTIDAGDPGIVIPVRVNGDNLFEGATESFIVELSNLSANAEPAQATLQGKGFIYDDDIFLSANGRTFKYPDVDGDIVTVTTSKGRWDLNDDFVFIPAGSTVGGRQLQTLNLAQVDVNNVFRGPIFANANITITAERPVGFPGLPDGTMSDGNANVGYIRAALIDVGTLQFTSGVDLGTVRIQGDLGRIDAGDLFISPAIKKLDVLSFGRGGVDTPDVNLGAPTSGVLGPISNFIVKGDFGGTLRVLGDEFGDIRNLRIGGALQGSTDGTAQILFTGDLHKAVIGSIQGGTGDGSAQIRGATAFATIGSINVVGAMTGGDGNDSGQIRAQRINSVTLGSLTGGRGLLSGVVISDGKLGSVTVNGDVTGSAQPLLEATTSSVTSGVIFGQTGIGHVKIVGKMQGGVVRNSASVLSNGGVSSFTVLGGIFGGSGEGSGSFQASDGIVSKIQVGSSTQAANLTGGTGVGSGLLLTGAVSNMTIFGDVIGGSANRTGGIEVLTSLGKSSIMGDIRGGNATGATLLESGYINTGSIGTLTLNGDLIAGKNNGTGIASSGAIRAADTIGSLTIKGSVLGDESNPALIAAGGVNKNLAIKKLNLGTGGASEVRFAEILAGYTGAISAASPRGEAVNGDAQIGNVVIGGKSAPATIRALNIIAGMTPGDDGRFGATDDESIPNVANESRNEVRLISRIASVIIHGTVVGHPAVDPLSYGIVAQEIGSIKVGTNPAIKLPSMVNSSNDEVIVAGTNFNAVQIKREV